MDVRKYNICVLWSMYEFQMFKTINIDIVLYVLNQHFIGTQFTRDNQVNSCCMSRQLLYIVRNNLMCIKCVFSNGTICMYYYYNT